MRTEMVNDIYVVLHGKNENDSTSSPKVLMSVLDKVARQHGYAVRQLSPEEEAAVREFAIDVPRYQEPEFREALMRAMCNGDSLPDRYVIARVVKQNGEEAPMSSTPAGFTWEVNGKGRMWFGDGTYLDVEGGVFHVRFT